MKNLLIIAALFLSSFALKAQINNYIFSNNQYNDTVMLCVGEPLFMSASGFMLADDFNTGSLSNLWSSNCSPEFTNPCLPSIDGGIYLWVGSATCFPRDLTTIPINVAPNFQVSFDMAYAIQGASAPCEGPDLATEGVHLQYSLDGTTWVDIDYWDPNGGNDPNLTNWNHYVLNVPPAAVSPHTQFQWHQDVSSGNGYDNWGIDNVYIGNTLCSVTWMKNNVPFANSFILPPLYPDSSTTYSLELICGTDTFFDSLCVIIDTTCLNFSGYVYEDANLNCIKDTGESGTQNVPIQLFCNNTLKETHWTDYYGHYNFNYLIDTSSYTLSLGSIPYPCLGLECPSGGSYIVDTSSNSLDFALQNIPGFDLSVYAYDIGFVPGQTSFISVFLNSLCNLQSGQLIMVHYDTLVHIQDVTIPPTQTSGDSLIWDFLSTSDLSNLCIVMYTDTNATIDDIVCFDFYVRPIVGDLDSINNHFPLCDNISSSIDPNDKHVSPHGIGREGFIQADVPLTYTINFQNTGTAPAQKVVIIDTLDTNLDLQTVTLLDYSHEVNVAMYGNILEFQFNNIMLPDSGTDYYASMGHVIYKVDQNPGLASLTHIFNYASIFFDYNEPVVTNYALNTIYYPTSIVFANQDKHHVKLFPNPANNEINIISSTKFNLKIIDIYGRLILKKDNCEKQSTIDISQLKGGIYFVYMNGENFVETARIVKL